MNSSYLSQIYNLDTNTDIVAQPQVTTRGMKLRVPLPQLLKRNPRLGVDRPAAVSTLYEVEGLAVIDYPGQLGSRA